MEILILTLIVYPYLIYPLILWILSKRRTKQQKNIKDIGSKKYSVTLLIAAYNEETVIKEKLDNALKLDLMGNNFEIVVGSDGSTDKTNEIVKAYSQKYPLIKLINYTDRAGKVNVINKSIAHCSGEIVILSDANAMYNAVAVINLLKHFSDSHVGCVAGEKRIKTTDNMISSNEGLYWKLESFIKKLEEKVSTVIGADGACYAIRKNLFMPLPQDTAVDDFLLSMKIVEQGYKIAYEKDAYSFEETGQTLQQELKRKIRIAAGNFYNLRFLKSFFSINLESFMFISHKFLRWISPIFFITLTVILLMNIDDIENKILFFILLLSYLIGVVGFFFQHCSITDNKIIKIITYFYLVVLAQLLGFIRFLKGTQKAIWETVRE